MANAEKGEVDLDVDGHVYTLVLNVNAMCELETLMSSTGQTVTCQDVLVRAVKQHSAVAFRAIFWACLREHHQAISLKQTGELMEKAGGVDGFAKKLAGLIFAVTPAKSDLDALGVKDRPQKAQRKRRGGTGTRSKSTPSTPA
jgi:hypothetical protein